MAGTASTKEKTTKAAPKAKAATAKKSGTPAKPQAAKASGPPIAKVVGTAVRRLAHATDPAKLKTLGLLAGNNHDADAIRKASGVAAEAIEGHLDALRRAKLIGVEKASGGKIYHLTDEGRKLWEAAASLA